MVSIDLLDVVEKLVDDVIVCNVKETLQFARSENVKYVSVLYLLKNLVKWAFLNGIHEASLFEYFDSFLHNSAKF